MTSSEIDLLAKMMSGCTHYLEYGSGQSTRRAVRTATIQSIVSVESDAAFVESFFTGDAEIAKARAAGRLEFFIARIGPTIEWGYPADHSHRHLWPNYPLAVLNKALPWDLVLVDGRFRLACCLAAALTLPATTPILVHDFTQRPHYQPVLEYLDCLEAVDSMVVLKRKPEAKIAALQDALREFSLNPN